MVLIHFALLVFCYIIITIIILATLFQEDNIFGTNASLTYGPQIHDTHAFDNYKKWKLFTVCTEQVKSPYTEHAASGLPNPIHLEGEVRFIQPQDQLVTTRSPTMVTECLLTRSMFILTYVPVVWPFISLELNHKIAAVYGTYLN